MKEQTSSSTDFGGAIIAYYNKGSLQTALVTKQIQDNLQIVNLDKSITQLKPTRVILSTDSRFALEHEKLISFWEDVQALSPTDRKSVV